MDINRANMDLLFHDVQVKFTEGYNAAIPNVLTGQIGMEVPSTSASTVHGWLNQIPGLREWVGDRQVNNIASNKQEIVNAKFEGTIEIDRTDIEDDQFGLYAPLAGTLGMRAAENPDKLIAAELVSNPTWLGDDAAFFGTSRVYGSNTISNYTATALSETTFEAAISAMQSYIGQNDESLMVKPFALVVGPANRGMAFDLCTNDFRAITAGGTVTDRVGGKNRNKGLVTPHVSQRLVGTYANYWFLMGQVGMIRGCVYQNRISYELQSQRMRDDNDNVFENDVYQIGVRSRGKAFLSLPHLIYGGFVAA